MYFFSNSPVRCRLTKVVCRFVSGNVSRVDTEQDWGRTRPRARRTHLQPRDHEIPYLACATVANKDELEGGWCCSSVGHGGSCLVGQDGKRKMDVDGATEEIVHRGVGGGTQQLGRGVNKQLHERQTGRQQRRCHHAGEEQRTQEGSGREAGERGGRYRRGLRGGGCPRCRKSNLMMMMMMLMRCIPGTTRCRHRSSCRLRR